MSTEVDCLLVLDSLTSIVAPMRSNYKAGGKVSACLIIDKWGLVYWKVGKDKVVSEYGLSRILLGDN